MKYVSSSYILLVQFQFQKLTLVRDKLTPITSAFNFNWRDITDIMVTSSKKGKKVGKWSRDQEK